jgi:hypothetical protein
MMSSTVWAHLVLSPATLHSVSSVTSCCRVIWHYSGAMRVVIVLALYCNRTIDACLHALQVLTTLSVCMSCRRMMTLT